MSIEAMKQAVEALKKSEPSDDSPSKWLEHYAAIVALRQAIEQAEKQPKEARYYPNEGHARVVWLGLTDGEITDLWASVSYHNSEEMRIWELGHAIEAKLKEKNHAS